MSISLLARYGMTKAAAVDGYRYFRLLITATAGGVTDIAGTHEFGLRTALAGASVAVGAGGTPSATNAAVGFEAAKAFDGITASGHGWVDNITGSLPVWVQYDFGAGNEKVIVQYTVSSYPTTTQTATRSPGDWKMQGSNDGSAWDDLDTVAGQSAWTIEETRVFTL